MRLRLSLVLAAAFSWACGGTPSQTSALHNAKVETPTASKPEVEESPREAVADTESSSVTAVTAATEIKLEAETWSLDNGLTVIFDQDKRLPIVAVEVRYLVGSAHERDGRSGFAHLFEHLMFQGSANADYDYFKPLEAIGGRINGTTSNDRTNYYQRVPREYLERVLWMESDRMANLLPALNQTKLDNQRDVVKNERRQNYEDRPYGMVWLRMPEGLYKKGHPYDHTPIGSHADLTAATLEDVKAFFKEYYAPANAVLTLSGDFDRAEAKRLIELYFGGLPSGKRAAMPIVKVKPSLDENVHIVEQDEVKLPRVHFVYHSPALYAEGDAALDVLSSILSSGKNSRLYRPLVMEQQVAKDVAAFQYSRALGGIFIVQATAAPGRTIEDLASALDEALKTALKTPPTQDEMARALNGWKKSFYGRLESAINRATLLSTYYHLAGDTNYLSKDLARYTAVDSATIVKTANAYLDTNRLRIDVVPVAPKAKGGASE